MRASVSEKTFEMIRHTETPQELAERWSVPVSWIYGQTRKRGPGAMPMLVVGKYRRFVPQEVDKWLRDRSRAE